jgi:large subunit ribosomal protein L21
MSGTRYAIIQDGGRQYKVTEGQILDLDYRDAAKGQEVVLDRVLAFRDESGLRIGRPHLAGSVTAEVMTPVYGPKLVVQKMRRRKNSRRKTGHRQIYSRVRIKKIEVQG